jgi:hypothetical protein
MAVISVPLTGKAGRQRRREQIGGAMAPPH